MHLLCIVEYRWMSATGITWNWNAVRALCLHLSDSVLEFPLDSLYACLAWCMLILHKLIMVLLQPRPPNEWVQLSLCLLCLTNCILWGDCEAVWWRKTQRHDLHVILGDKKHERYCISQLSCSNGSSGGQGVSQGTVLLLCADSVGWMFQQQWAGRKQGDPERSHT